MIQKAVKIGSSVCPHDTILQICLVGKNDAKNLVMKTINTVSLIDKRCSLLTSYLHSVNHEISEKGLYKKS